MCTFMNLMSYTVSPFPGTLLGDIIVSLSCWRPGWPETFDRTYGAPRRAVKFGTAILTLSDGVSSSDRVRGSRSVICLNGLSLSIKASQNRQQLEFKWVNHCENVLGVNWINLVAPCKRHPDVLSKMFFCCRNHCLPPALALVSKKSDIRQ